MSRRSLRPQLNQIRAWVREGRTDAWIAHQLEVSASELKEFRRQHDLSPDADGDNGADVDLRDEIEAEIEAAAAAEEEALAKEREAAEAEEKAAAEAAGESDSGDDAEDERDEDDEESDGSEAEGRPRRRRRRGRRGGRREQSGNELEGTFDHGEEGYGLWLDPAVQDIAAYRESWAGKRDVTVTVEADQIIIRRNDS